MAFELRVQFAGICMFVVDDKEKQVGVLMPDARVEGGVDQHPDTSPARFHVGYLRFDLANLANLNPRFATAGGGENPLNEGVHQFDREDLEFVVEFDDGEDGDITRSSSGLPEFEKIAPDPGQPNRSRFQLKPGTFKPQPHDKLLMRTILRGGKLEGEATADWYFPNLYKPGQPVYQDQFPGSVRWTCRVKSVTVRIRKFDGSQTIEFPLSPVNEGEVVHVKVANLCSHNPLEWENLESRQAARDDDDFKWLYLLFEEPQPGWRTALLGDRFPHPHRPDVAAAGDEGCVGGSIHASTV